MPHLTINKNKERTDKLIVRAVWYYMEEHGIIRFIKEAFNWYLKDIRKKLEDQDERIKVLEEKLKKV